MANAPRRPARRRPVATAAPATAPEPEAPAAVAEAEGGGEAIDPVEETLPATTEDNLPAVPGQAYQVPGMEDYGDEQGDFIVPRLSIVQPMSDEGTEGNFRNSLDGAEFERLEGLYFIRVGKARVMFPAEYKRGQDPLCRSDDNLVPDPRIENPPSDDCATCMNSVWGEDGSPPPCNLVIRLLAIQDGLPCWMDFKSTQITPLKKFLSALNLQAKKRRMGIWNFKIDVDLVEKTFESGKAYLPVFSKLRFEENPEGNEMYEAYKEVEYKVPDEQEQEASA
jgi:hypothetical protein